MPDAKAEAIIIQRNYYGKPDQLAKKLAEICLQKTDVVHEVFILLNNYSTLDVGCRFNGYANLPKLVNKSKGYVLCQKLHKWLTGIRVLTNPPACVGNFINLSLLKSAIENAKPEAEKTEKENRYYTIDEGIVLEADAIAILNKIGPSYFEKIGKKFNVNSGTRNSYRQADAMYNVYINGDKTLHLYRNKTVVNELLEIINNGRKTGKTKTSIIQKMTDVIQKYFEKGILLSGHQKAGAIDIDINGDVGIAVMSDSDIKVMMAIAFKVTGFKALLEKSPPHLHIKFK